MPMALGAFVVGVWFDPVPVRGMIALAVAVASGTALGVSVVRRKAGVAGSGPGSSAGRLGWRP